MAGRRERNTLSSASFSRRNEASASGKQFMPSIHARCSVEGDAAMIPRLQTRAPRLRKVAGSFNGRTPRFGRGNLSSNLSPAATSKKRKSIHRGPAKHWLTKPAVVLRGDREICNPATDEGRAEYKYRTLLLWLRQDGWCCFHEYEFCPGRLKLRDATFEHERKRTKAQRTDALSYFDAAGKEIPLNGACHMECNRIVGSRKLPIWHGTNTSFQLGAA